MPELATLLPYQEKGVRKIDHFQGRALLADDMGLGKTLQALTWAYRNNLYPLLIICPATVKGVWQSQIKQHFGMSSSILYGRKPTKKGLKTEDIVIINYEIVADWMKVILHLNFKAMICDECHYIKEKARARTKAIMSLSRNIQNTVFISGTPLVNRPIELWPTLNCIKPELFPSYWSFGYSYCDPKKNHFGGGVKFSGATNSEKLHKILLSEVMIRRRKQEVLTDLPEKRREVISVSLDNYREYNTATKDFLNWIGDNNPSKLNGAMKAESIVKMGELKRLAANLKLPSVFEWIDNFLESTEEKLVIMGVHTKVLESIHDKYKNSVLVNGSVSSSKRTKLVEDFQTNPKTRIFVGNIQAAGVGITLTAASYMLFVEMDWVPGKHSQAEDRIHRIGQKNSALIYYMVATNTIEEELCLRIQEKQKVINAILDGQDLHDMDLMDMLVEALRRKS